jgi:hypothetical protein
VTGGGGELSGDVWILSGRGAGVCAWAGSDYYLKGLFPKGETNHVEYAGATPTVKP